LLYLLISDRLYFRYGLSASRIQPVAYLLSNLCNL
jgi:hypothetical protein